VNYFKESFEEIKKVTWLTSNKALKITVITIIFTAISTLVVTGLDFSFRKGYDSLVELSPKVQQSPVTPSNSQELPIDIGSAVQAVDAEGNPVDVNVTPVAVPPNTNPSN
jgi:preprotein translocase SecE subunit